MLIKLARCIPTDSRRRKPFAVDLKWCGICHNPTPPHPQLSRTLGLSTSHLWVLPTTIVMTLCLRERDIHKLFKRQNSCKAVGSDSVSPSTLKHCADQLSQVFTVIFNTSLETCHVPACFKVSTIIPVPKKPRTTGLNDYRSPPWPMWSWRSLSALCCPTSNP